MGWLWFFTCLGSGKAMPLFWLKNTGLVNIGKKCLKDRIFLVSSLDSIQSFTICITDDMKSLNLVKHHIYSEQH